MPLRPRARTARPPGLHSPSPSRPARCPASIGYSCSRSWRTRGACPVFASSMSRTSRMRRRSRPARTVSDTRPHGGLCSVAPRTGTSEGPSGPSAGRSGPLGRSPRTSAGTAACPRSSCRHVGVAPHRHGVGIERDPPPCDGVFPPPDAGVTLVAGRHACLSFVGPKRGHRDEQQTRR
jgi:hypothetical protein